MTAYTTTINLRDRALCDELVRRAERLESRARELALGAEDVRWPEGTAKDTARYYAKQLGLLDLEVAQEVLRVLVDEGELSSNDFWRSDLGRALFLLGAGGVREVNRTTAQALLRTKSRQRLHQLIVSGELQETMGGMITADSVRSLFHVQ